MTGKTRKRKRCRKRNGKRCNCKNCDCKNSGCKRRADEECQESPYEVARDLAVSGDRDAARRQYAKLQPSESDKGLLARIENDLGVLDWLDGNVTSARQRFTRAEELDGKLTSARKNLDQTNSIDARTEPRVEPVDTGTSQSRSVHRIKVALVSCLFNWPSTGGGTIHTGELSKFLGEAGFEVRHFSARYDEWEIGIVKSPPPAPVETLQFDEVTWNVADIQERFRSAVRQFDPDHIIVTDSWNMKPILAEAVSEYPYFLRIAAMETLCPLNNVRLLFGEDGRAQRCPRHQLETPDICQSCVAEQARNCGPLHEAERLLSGYGTAEYQQRLLQSVANAEGVLAVNPLIAEMFAPYAQAVHVIPSGFDSKRFPWPWPEPDQPRARTKILYAGLTHEAMKGFHVLEEACSILWNKRQDFELVATGDSLRTPEPWDRYVGWQSQESLPRLLRSADIVAFPTVAEEALGRTAVEAMGVGRPVVASRIGGLPYTVTDGATGLLFEPGSAQDLSNKLELLLDDEELRQRMGEAGRRRFVEEFTWESVIERQYRPLLRQSAVSEAT